MDKIHKELAAESTKLHLNQPYGPHYCSAWERLTQIVKRTLLIFLGPKRLTFDLFHTIMFKAEAIMESKPHTNGADAVENDETFETPASVQLPSTP